MAFTTRQPVGVVGMITPWNFPVAIPSWKMLPALLAGNGIVIKPSEHAPACCEAFVADAVATPACPPISCRWCTASARSAPRSPCTPASRAVSFTGSVPTGRQVAAAAMEHGPKLVSLELGGKNAMVVMDDADLDLVVDGALFGAFGTSGQRCTSTSRLVVHRAVRDEVVDRIAQARREARARRSRPQPGTDVGPVIDTAARERIDGDGRAARRRGRDRGAPAAHVVEVDGCDGGAFYAPTILTGVRPEHRIARERGVRSGARR